MKKPDIWDILCVVLTLLFLGLKLMGITEVAHWSWWSVFAPIWVPVLVMFALGMMGLV